MTGSPLVVVFASHDQTRHRGAVLADVGGRPALELLLRRLSPLEVQVGATIVVATSDLAIDDQVADLARDLHARVVRGPVGDALGLATVALVRYPADVVALLSATGPLGDPFVVLAALELQRSSGAALVTNLLPRSYPAGLDVEVATDRAVRACALETAARSGHDQITAHLRSHPERFALANLSSGHDLASERWTIDSASDLERTRAIVAQIPDPLTASWNRISSVVGRSARPRPGQLVLRPGPDCPPGSSPWVQRWTVVVDGDAKGEVTLTTEAGRTTRDYDVPDRWLEAAREATYRLLHGDPTALP